MKYKNLSDIPNHIKKKIEELGQPDLENWVKKPIPALENQSILDVLNQEDGENKVFQYLKRAEGYFSR